ncbi:hypothetical protein HYZ97_01365 [Candidatus Pacearchaeota archaeon]|nr:hypothetical protein [Candidatus Pacearchaeota archaeon]
MSNVVAVVLLMLVVVAALGVLGTVVLKLTKSPQLTPGVSCLDIKVQGPPIIQAACYNATTQEVQVTIFRPGASIELIELEFILSSINQRWQAGGSCEHCTLLEKGSTKTYYLSSGAHPETATLAVGSCTLDTKTVPVCE